MTAYRRGYDQMMRIEQLRPGMIFVDAARRNRRVVILKVVEREFKIWMCIVGGPKGPYFVQSVNHYWGATTPHNKHRRSGLYLDGTIPGNSASDWQAVIHLGS